MEIERLLIDVASRARSEGINGELIMLVHPKDLSEILKSQSFIDVSRYPVERRPKVGEIGRMMGITIIVDSRTIEGKPTLLPEISKVIDQSAYEDFNPSRRYNPYVLCKS